MCGHSLCFSSVSFHFQGQCVIFRFSSLLRCNAVYTLQYTHTQIYLYSAGNETRDHMVDGSSFRQRSNENCTTSTSTSSEFSFYLSLSKRQLSSFFVLVPSKTERCEITNELHNCCYRPIHGARANVCNGRDSASFAEGTRHKNECRHLNTL